MSDEKELTIKVLPAAQAQMDADPDLAKAMKGFFEAVHQAHAGVANGTYASFQEGIKAITGEDMVPVNEGEEGDDE